MEEAEANEVAQEIMEAVIDAASEYLYDSEIMHGLERMREYKKEIAVALIEAIEEWGS